MSRRGKKTKKPKGGDAHDTGRQSNPADAATGAGASVITPVDDGLPTLSPEKALFGPIKHAGAELLGPEEAAPCPWCRAGETTLWYVGKFHDGKRWFDAVAVHVRHWCPRGEIPPQQPAITRVGYSREEAIARWNTFAAPTETYEG